MADADTYTVDEDNTLTINADGGVLANDSDVDGDDLEAVLVNGPANGTLTLGDDGSFTYEPNDDFNGTDSFTYHATDGTLTSATTTVTITVNAVNDTPVGTTDTYAVDEDNTLTVNADGGVLVNDSDIDGDNLEAVLVSSPTNGSLTLNTDGSFTTNRATTSTAPTALPTTPPTGHSIRRRPPSRLQSVRSTMSPQRKGTPTPQPKTKR